VRALERLDPGWGVTAVRVMTGIILVAAGWAKLTGGIEGFANGLAQMGFPAPAVVAPLVVAFELIGGLMVLAGAFVRWLGLPIFVYFLIITFVIKLPGQGGFNSGRIDLMMAAAGLMLLLAGAGRASVDDQLARRRGATTVGRM